MSVKQMSLVWELDLHPNHKIILLAYADHAHDDGSHVFPSLKRIAYKTGYSRDQVRRISRELKEAGLMEQVADPTYNRPAEYMLTLERGSKLPPLEKRGVANDPPQVGANDPPQVGAPMPPEPSIEPSIEPSDTPVGAPATPDATADTFVSCLAEDLNHADVPLLQGRKARYGKEFKEQLAKGVAPSLVFKAADRIVERWLSDDHRKLTVELALEDVVNGKPPMHARDHLSVVASSSPPEAIEAVRNRADLARYTGVVKSFDFTSLEKGEEPEYKVFAKIGNDDMERWRNLDRLWSVCNRAVRDRKREVAQ